jgi:hypothetical protein
MVTGEVVTATVVVGEDGLVPYPTSNPVMADPPSPLAVQATSAVVGLTFEITGVVGASGTRKVVKEALDDQEL